MPWQEEVGRARRAARIALLAFLCALAACATKVHSGRVMFVSPPAVPIDRSRSLRVSVKAPDAALARELASAFRAHALRSGAFGGLTVAGEDAVEAPASRRYDLRVEVLEFNRLTESDRFWYGSHKTGPASLRFQATLVDPARASATVLDGMVYVAPRGSADEPVSTTGEQIRAAAAILLDHALRGRDGAVTVPL